MPQRTLLAFLCIATLILSGCATQKKSIFHYAETKENIVWPSGSDVPRYQYVGQLLGEENFSEEQQSGIRQTLIKGLKWVVGLFSSKLEYRGLQRPQIGTVGDDGRIYVTDVSRQGIYVFDMEAGSFDIWDWAEQNKRFLSPIGIASGRDGEILVSDSELRRVFRLSPTGEPLGSFGNEILERPTGLARDPKSGKIYVADSRADNIKVFSDDGNLIDVIGAPGENVGEFNGPVYLNFTRGRLYVTDVLNARIQVLDTEGDYVKGFGRRGLFVGDIPHPKGVAVDSDENVYVIESMYDHMLVFNSNGELLLPIGGTGQAVGQFYLPAGIWIDRQDRIYVADMFNGRIMVFQYLGGVSN